MNKKTYWYIITGVLIYTFLSMFVYLKSYPNLIYNESINAYSFWYNVVLSKMYEIFIILFPLFVFIVIHYVNKTEKRYSRLNNSLIWIIPMTFVIIMFVGYIIYGFGSEFEVREYRYVHQDFPYLGEDSPLKFVFQTLVISSLLTSVLIDLYVISKRVTKTTWLLFPLYLSLYIFFGFILGMVVNEVLASFIDKSGFEYFWYIPNFDANWIYTFIYYIGLKLVFLVVIYFSYEKKGNDFLID